MNDIIIWCDDNYGFLAAILSSVGLLVSVIAIVVSIKTAHLPYKKILQLQPPRILCLENALKQVTS